MVGLARWGALTARTLAALCPAASSAAPTSPTEIIVDGLCCSVNSSEKGNEKYKLPGELAPGMRSEIRPLGCSLALARETGFLFFSSENATSQILLLLTLF